MRSSVSALSSRRGSTAVCTSGPSYAPFRARVVVATAAAAAPPPQRRRLRSSLFPTMTKKAPSTMRVEALSGDETGLVTALSSAPKEAVAALGAVLVGLGAIVASALAGEKKSSPAGSSSSSSSSSASSSAPAPPPPPRRDAVAVFGASGKVGRQIVKSLLMSSSSNQRTVVAAVRSAERAREVFSEIGIDVESSLRTGSLSIVGGIDVTNAATLSPNPELWQGVSQAAVSLGPIFARLPGGGMGYLDGMTSEAVDARGVSALVEAMKKEMSGAALPAAAADDAKRETTPLAPMGSAADLEGGWDPLDDVIMGGKSSSSLSIEEERGGKEGGEGKAVAAWKGELVLEGGGFCGTRTKKGALNVAFGPPPPSSPDSSSAFSSLPRFDGVELRVRSDRGQTFKLNLKTASQEDAPEATYQALLDTSAGGEWTTLRLPWSSFVATRRARFDAAAPSLAEVARAGGPAAAIRLVGLVLSRFEFDGAPNPRCGGPGPFRLEVDGGGIRLFTESAALRRPACVLLTSAAIERNARIGDDAELRARDVPIVRLNPGGALNWKYVGEAALRRSGLSYAVVRPTGLNDEEVKPAETAEGEPPAAPAVFPVVAGQGDTISGVISRPEVARVVVAALNPLSCASSSGSSSNAAFSASPVGKTIEVRRGLPADAERLGPGQGRDDAALARLWRGAVPDRERHLFGLPPLPAPCPPPPPPAEEEVKKVLADPRVAAAAAAADNARGGRVRSEEEASRAGSVVVADDGRERASEGKSGGGDGEKKSDDDDDDKTPPPPSKSKSSAPSIPENVAEAKEWVAAWRQAQSAQ